MLGGCVIMRSISIDSLELEGDALHISQIQFHASLRLLVISYHLTLILETNILHFLASRLLISSLCEFHPQLSPQEQLTPETSLHSQL